jgi:hypothetical protein
MNFESPNNNEDSKLDKLKKAGKKAVFSTALAAGLSAGSGEAVAQNQEDLLGDKIENVEQENKYEHMTQEVDAKGLKKLIDGYEGAIGQPPLSMILKNYKDQNFFVSRPIPGMTKTGASFHASEEMKLSGKWSPAQYEFYKNTSRGVICILVCPERN